MADIKIKKPKLAYYVEEAYKSLRTNLFFCGRDKKIIAITSCIPHEGKSTVSLNLAMSLAEANKKVILIDADLRNSDMMTRIQLTGDKYGLAYYLSGLVSYDQMICSTDCENLDMILSGRFPPNPSELLSDPTFTTMLQQLRDNYDYVIVDTPPVGRVIDSAIIAESCDGLIMVLEANTISYRLAQQVKEQLEKTSCPILGAILNKVSPDVQGYGRYAQYGQQSGKAYGRQNQQQSEGLPKWPFPR